MNHAHHPVRNSVLGVGLGRRLAIAALAIALLWGTVIWALS